MKLADELKKIIRDSSANYIELYDIHNILFAAVPIPMSIFSFIQLATLRRSSILKPHLNDEVYFSEMVNNPLVGTSVIRIRLNIDIRDEIHAR